MSLLSDFGESVDSKKQLLPANYIKKAIWRQNNIFLRENMRLSCLLLKMCNIRQYTQYINSKNTIFCF